MKFSTLQDFLKYWRIARKQLHLRFFCVWPGDEGVRWYTYGLRNLVPFVWFKKTQKNTHGRVLLLPLWMFSTFLNCTTDTKSAKRLICVGEWLCNCVVIHMTTKIARFFELFYKYTKNRYYGITRFFICNTFYKQRQAEIGKKRSKS